MQYGRRLADVGENKTGNIRAVQHASIGVYVKKGSETIILVQQGVYLQFAMTTIALTAATITDNFTASA